MTADADGLRRRTWELLQPGSIDLDGLIVHTSLGGAEDIEMHRATVDVGNEIATAVGVDPADTYVYSGTDDPEFASNQHQGLTLDGDDFVWECQQLLRDGSFDLVFYFEAGADLEALCSRLRERDFTVTAVRGDTPQPGAGSGAGDADSAGHDHHE